MELIGEMYSTETDAGIEHYLNMCVASDFDDKSLTFWPCHEESLPVLSIVTQVYLGMSSSSVPVECLFSTTGIISNGRRSSIGPYKLNRVAFIHDNFSLAVGECK